VTSLWQTPAVVLAVLAWLTSPPGSLADAARREAMRRQMTPPSAGSYSNIGSAQDPAPPAAVTFAGQTTEAPPPAAQTEPPPAEPATPPRDEKWWRARIAAVRAALERNELLAESVQSRINGLQADVVNRDDPAQQAMLRQQLGKSIDELGRLKQQIEQDRKAMADIHVEARRAGVPPGWLRER
jgi:hypothetical protein